MKSTLQCPFVMNLSYFQLYRPKKIAELARKLEKGKPILAIYAGSSRNANFRRWPLNKYLKLINSLRNKWNICFIGGPDEEEISKNISN